MSLMNGDMAIIREWAEAKVSGRHFATDCDLKVARYILASMPAPTMAETEWDDDVHAGLCAEHPVYGAVRMIGANPAGDIQFLYAEEGRLRHRWTHPANLTPIPGTKIDLAPRREQGPEPTPEHPAVLTTREDYENAPAGTIAADDDGAAVKVSDGTWKWTGSELSYRSDDLCYGESDPMTVARWGK